MIREQSGGREADRKKDGGGTGSGLQEIYRRHYGRRGIGWEYLEIWQEGISGGRYRGE